jgi:beta-galactosidase
MQMNLFPGNDSVHGRNVLRLVFSALFFLVSVAMAKASAISSTGPRTIISFDQGWKFSRGDFPNAMIADFDDSKWRSLNVPHDWSIEGPLGPEYASGTGFAPGGIGWYRKSFQIDRSVSNQLVAIEFDGIYQNAQVWLNGHLVGGRPYGYSSFEIDLTPHVKFGAANLLSVRVDHTKFSDSRWYTGSGIYRHVRIRLTDKLRIAQWGTYVTTPDVNSNSAAVRIETELRNDSVAANPFTLETEILNPSGAVVGSHVAMGTVAAVTNLILQQVIAVSNPQRWSDTAPQLYSLRQRVRANGGIADETLTPFGIRTIRFDPNQGFFLNDVSMKLKGVCLHHDAGALGAAVPVAVWERRLQILKTLGVNAIRTSHNPPAPELLDLCDRLGFLVQDEALDEFTPPKNKWMQGWNSAEPSRYGYGEIFEQWAVRDVEDMVRRDRNHPSIVMWSIGNEIDYANDPFTHPVLGENFRPDHPRAENLTKHAKPLVAAVKRLDATRPVTAALATVHMSDAVGLGDLLDVVGYNYQEQRYPGDHAERPKRVIYGSENGHGWNAWLAVRDNDYISAQFLWTGIDYLGEAGRWPNHANGAGLLDLCGFKKPLAWHRQSLWSEKPMVYLCAAEGGQTQQRRGRMRADESWNWTEGSTVNVRCFTTCAEVELSLNGRVIGTKRRTDAQEGTLSFQVPFEPGTLVARGRDGGNVLAEFSLQTAAEPKRVQLISDEGSPRKAGNDIHHIQFVIVDAKGIRIPDAATEVQFKVEGAAEILGIENGDLNSTDDYKDAKHPAHRGRGLVILRAAGPATLTATAAGLETGSIAINQSGTVK